MYKMKTNDGENNHHAITLFTLHNPKLTNLNNEAMYFKAL